MTVDEINTSSSKLVILGWFAGLAYYNWFATAPIPVPIWGHAILIVVGMFAASMIIGGGIAVAIGKILMTSHGNPEALPGLFALGGLIATVIAFFSAKYALMLFA